MTPVIEPASAPRRDTLAGAGADEVILRRGDLLDGCGGADNLSGGQGSDRIEGGAGRDRFQGDKGADRLVFGRDGRDTVRDFEDDVDTLRLDPALWEGDLKRGAVVDRFAEIRDGRVVLDFGRHEIAFDGIDDPHLLRNDIAIA